jgi:hypothetical protein
MGQKEMAVTGKNRIMIYGPKNDGTYVVEFRTAKGEVLAISIPRTETAVIEHFQESRAALQWKGGMPMSTIAAAAVTTDRIDATGWRVMTSD